MRQAGGIQNMHMKCSSEWIEINRTFMNLVYTPYLSIYVIYVHMCVHIYTYVWMGGVTA